MLENVVQADLLTLGSLALGGLGGIFGSRSDSKARKIQQQQFNAQMDESVQRRVADARKAGIHPLFALGASVGATPGSAVGGQGASNALNSLSRSLMEAQIAKTRAETQSEVASSQLLSARARAAQDLASRGLDTLSKVEAGEIDAGNPKVEITPRQVTATKSTGVAAGTGPLKEEFINDDGRTIRTFSSDSQMDELRQLDVARQMAQHAISDFMVGVDPKQVHKTIPGKLKSMENQLYLKSTRNKVRNRLQDTRIRNRFSKMTDWQLTKLFPKASMKEKKIILQIQHRRATR